MIVYFTIQSKHALGVRLLSIGIRVVGDLSWNEREIWKFQVGEFPFKLERTERSWKVSSGVGKLK